MTATPSNGRGRAPTGRRAPTPATGTLPVFKITSTSWHDFIIVSPRMYGVEVHYHHPRTQPVTDGQRADPVIYNALVGRRWQGWLCVREYDREDLGLLAVTSWTVHCVPQLDAPDVDLRGWTIGVKRATPDRFGKLLGRWNNRRAIVEKLSASPDVPDHLVKMWDAPTKPETIKPRDVPSREDGDGPQLLADILDSLTIPT